MTLEEAMANNPVYIAGVDPGPESSAFAVYRTEDPLSGAEPELVEARYAQNSQVASDDFPMLLLGRVPNGAPVFLIYEKCGAQANFVGESVFETAAMGGEIRRAFRNFVAGTYVMRSSEWRHALTGKGNAKTPEIYQELCRKFRPTGGGADAFKGTTAQPGPLWGLHQAGKGGNVEHLKDALGAAIGLTMVRFRGGKSPETYRRDW